jgi:hypothetical protein
MPSATLLVIVSLFAVTRTDGGLHRPANHSLAAPDSLIKAISAKFLAYSTGKFEVISPPPTSSTECDGPSGTPANTITRVTAPVRFDRQSHHVNKSCRGERCHNCGPLRLQGRQKNVRQENDSPDISVIHFSVQEVKTCERKWLLSVHEP